MEDVWAAGDAYEPYVGRWSRLVAEDFVDWLQLQSGSACLDVGCGTGALTARLTQVGPATGIDQSEGFVAYAAQRVPEASFLVGDAQRLPFDDDQFDAAVSGLVLNFVPDQHAMIAEMSRVVKPGGTVAIYVWDYADGMRFMRLFWDVAAVVDPDAPDEAARFPICAPGPLDRLLRNSGFGDVVGREFVVPTDFSDFDDLWNPFLGGQGAAPAYLAGLSASQRQQIRDRYAESVPTRPDGSIELAARAYAVRGTV